MRALKSFLKQKKGYCNRLECKCNLISLWRDYQGHPEYCGCGVDNSNGKSTQNTGRFKPVDNTFTPAVEPKQTEEIVESVEEETTEETEEPEVLDLNELNS